METFKDDVPFISESELKEIEKRMWRVKNRKNVYISGTPINILTEFACIRKDKSVFDRITIEFKKDDVFYKRVFYKERV